MHDLDTLKKLMVQSKEISEAFEYFFTLREQKSSNEMKNERFIPKPKKHVAGHALLTSIEYHTGRLLGKPVQMIRPFFYEVPAAHFCHGVCETVEPALSIIGLYFSDIQQGIFTFSNEGSTEMFRFALAIVNEWENTPKH